MLIQTAENKAQTHSAFCYLPEPSLSAAKQQMGLAGADTSFL